MKYDFSFFSNKGGRKINEDSLYCNNVEEGFFAIIADGLGSHGGGDIASKMAVDIFSKKLNIKKEITDEMILTSFDFANNKIVEKQTSVCKMKTTVVMAICQKDRVLFAHIGDSRGYFFKNNIIKYQTLDHSVSQMAVLSGEITPDKIRFHEDRNRLLRTLGSDTQVNPEITVLESNLEKGDAVLLCSDGFWEYITELEMQIDLSKSKTAKDWLSYMAQRIGKKIDGKNDNLSVIAMIVEE